MEKSIYEIEFELRREFSQQYFKCRIDDGHHNWMNHLTFLFTPRNSGYFWNEIVFQQIEHNRNDQKRISGNYHLIYSKIGPHEHYFNQRSDLDIYDLNYNERGWINDDDIVKLFHDVKNLEYW